MTEIVDLANTPNTLIFTFLIILEVRIPFLFFESEAILNYGNGIKKIEALRKK